MNTNKKSFCYAELRSMTEALKAQSLLSKAAISSEVTKISGSRQGCSYGIRVLCTQKNHIFTTLAAAGIYPLEWKG